MSLKGNGVAMIRSMCLAGRRQLRRVRRFSVGLLSRAIPSLGCLLLLWAVNGAQPVSKLRPPKVKAWIDAKGLCLLPLGEGLLPLTREQLAISLTEGWKRSLRLRDPSRVVTVDGGTYPSVELLRIDLSDGRMDPKPKHDKFNPSNRPDSRLGVASFQMVGQPLLCEKARINLDISASAVSMDLEHDRKGRHYLMLSQAKNGRFSVVVTCDDIEQLVLSMAREAAAPYGVTVTGTRFALDMEGDRSLTARLHLSTKVGFIPAGMTFAAHVDIDDAMNAKLSDLQCAGDEVLGPLIVGLLRPGLTKYEGKTRPLVSFASTDMHLRDFRLKVDDSIHLTAMFGSN